MGCFRIFPACITADVTGSGLNEVRLALAHDPCDLPWLKGIILLKVPSSNITKPLQFHRFNHLHSQDFVLLAPIYLSRVKDHHAGNSIYIPEPMDTPHWPVLSLVYNTKIRVLTFNLSTHLCICTCPPPCLGLVLLYLFVFNQHSYLPLLPGYGCHGTSFLKLLPACLHHYGGLYPQTVSQVNIPDIDLCQVFSYNDENTLSHRFSIIYFI